MGRPRRRRPPRGGSCARSCCWHRWDCPWRLLLLLLLLNLLLTIAHFTAGTPGHTIHSQPSSLLTACFTARPLLPFVVQAQLADARQQQAVLEGERQQLVREREEEEARLQEGLAQALSQASCAQREADAAAERATHWCSLAQLLQRSALLPEGLDPSSPASLASLYSPAASSTAKSSLAASRSCSRTGEGCGGASSGGAPRQLVADYWSPGAQAPRQAAASCCSGEENPGAAAAAASGGAPGDRASLIAAFHAVATASTECREEQQLQGSPVLQRCQSPARQQPRPAEAGLAASAHLAPGCHLQLLHKLPTPGMSFASSLGGGGGGGNQSPLTPEPFAAALPKVPGSPPASGSVLSASLEESEQHSSSTTGSMSSRASSSTAETLSLASSVTSLAAAAAPTPPSPHGASTSRCSGSGNKPAQLVPAPRSSFLRKLLCAGRLPPAGAAHPHA